MNNFITVPERNWEWCLNGEWNSIRFQAASAPCLIHRVMQRLLLGIVWRRVT